TRHGAPDPLPMHVIRDAVNLKAAARSLCRPSGLGGVLVPTMGALQAGLAALIRHAAAIAVEGRCVVSIFVNPTQLNEAADFQRYPRTLEADLALSRESGAAMVFAPDTATMYPSPDATPVPPLPAVARLPGLEDAHRPGHFAGVCQVVM